MCVGEEAESADSFEFLQLEAALLLAGVMSETVLNIQKIIREISVGPKGYQRVGKTLKQWKSTVVDILARLPVRTTDDRFDTCHSRKLSRSQHILRTLGFTAAEISSAVLIHGVRRIPPFLFDPVLVRCLLPDPSFEVLSRCVSLANISRTGPSGRRAEVLSALAGFRSHVSREQGWSIDLTIAIERMLSFHGFRGSNSSHWEVTSRASRDFPRALDGKVGDFVDNYLNKFRYEPVSTFLEFVPERDLFDITGSLVLRVDNLNLDDRFCDVAYPDIGPPNDDFIDRRLGHLGVFWALWELRQLASLEFEAVESCVNLGIGFTPSLRITGGSIESRVAPIPEAGLKVRVITIVSFFVALIGSVARHQVDTALLDLDPMIRIGLTSKVKLYDFMVNLNSGCHRGVASLEPNSLSFDSALSVDLTTATDTPPLATIRSSLNGLVRSQAGIPGQAFLQLAVDLAVCPRVFRFPDGSRTDVHNCGIMMGEGLSGIHLNLCSALVRYAIREFRAALPQYSGETISDADEFISKNQVLLQDIVNNFQFTSPSTSVQSGDDVTIFSFEKMSGHLILLYRVLGFLPSEDSWYESSYMATFTEEIALKTRDSNGWTFVDTVKPRLFRCKDAAGEIAVASRIKQIGDSLRYLGDLSVSDRLIPLCDRMIDSCESLSRVIRQLHIPVGLPTWLGGLGHPIGDDPGYFLSVDQRYKDLLLALKEGDIDFLVKVFVTGDPLYEEISEDEDIQLLALQSMLLGGRCTIGEFPSGCSWIPIADVDVIAFPGEKWSHVLARRELYCRSNGLVNLTEFCQWLRGALNSKRRLGGEPTVELPIAHRLRRKQELLFSLIPDQYTNISALTDEDIFRVFKRCSYVLGSMYWHKETLLTVLGLELLPKFSVSFCA